ncbi:L,D-transpeptidase family protein [bacterium]|nr:L,D-transpeptidase family protein [bacterium]
MDSIKSIVVVAILLGVLYGIYQVINDDPSSVPNASSQNLLADFDSDDKLSVNQKNIQADSPANGESHPPMESSLESNLKPPPSTFDPSLSNDSNPDLTSSTARTQSSDANSSVPFPARDFNPTGVTNTDATENKIASNSSPNNQATFIDSSRFPKSSAPENSTSQFAEPTSQPSATNTGSDQSKNSFLTIPSDSDVKPDTNNIQTAATATTRDFRNRFVKGSLAEFTQQVGVDMKKAEQLIRADQFYDALKILTQFYDDPRLTREENNNLKSWLDPLAGKVIYSVEHHIVDAYFVKHNDTLNLLSAKLHVPPELIFNINRVQIPNQKKLVPGTELKVIQGPFNVEISISKKILTLFVADVYAGTFPVRIGNEPSPVPGKYRVLTKSRLGQDYSDKNYQRIPAQSPDNPYGDFFLSIGNDMSIHSSAKRSDSNDSRGCISLNAVDAEDIHNILTTESTVIVVE